MRIAIAFVAGIASASATGLLVPEAPMAEWSDWMRDAVAQASSCEAACKVAASSPPAMAKLRMDFCHVFATHGTAHQCANAMSDESISRACEAGCANQRACDLEADQRARHEFDVVRRLWLAGQAKQPSRARFVPIVRNPGHQYTMVADLLAFNHARDSPMNKYIAEQCSGVSRSNLHQLQQAAQQACEEGRSMALALGCNASVTAREMQAMNELAEVDEDGSVIMGGNDLDEGDDAETAEEAANAARFRGSQESKAKEEAAKQRAAEEEAAKQRAAEEEAARQRAAEEEAARQRAAEEEAARQRAAEEEAARQRAAEEEAARQRAAEEEAARQRAAEEEAARQRAAEEDAARQRAAEEEAARQRAAEEEAARQRAAEANE
ncbi:hypothetical protein FNF31_03769 [Cafeteria roenbergensis]|uniref:VDE lipocalin domain-containing protein n=1 Tax=Cafeteria roenbergensis TaxID=33653 RepID=A0A5A8D7X8_CAFRO|nr:hypothetical protein FNF31_03769 [Cafeteria roenbergensis]